MRVVTSINTKGPFFTKDVAKTIAQNVEVMMAAVADEGERDVRVQLETTEGSRAPMSLGAGLQGGTARRTNRLSDNVYGRVRGNVPWRRWAAVSLYEPSHSTEDAIALYAAMAGRHQGRRGTTEGVESATHAFRRTTSRLRRSKAAQVAELTKGLT